MYSDLMTGELEQGVAAGVATRTAINCPTFFAWKRNDIVKNEEAVIPTESTPEVVVVDVPVPEHETVDVVELIKEEETVVPTPCELQTKKVEESPLVSYEDAIDASKWKSEYNTNFMQKEQEEEVSPVAGVANKTEAAHPSNFAWDGGINLLPPPPPASADNIFKYDSSDVNAVSEYAENFRKRSECPIVVEKSFSGYETSAPIPIYNDHVNASNWRSEYSSNFNPNKVPSTTTTTTIAPVPVPELPLMKDDESVVIDNDYNEPETDNQSAIEDTYVLVDSSSIPKFNEVEGAEEIADLPLPSSRINSGRSNMENILYFPKTEIEVASQEASNVEPAKARKLWFTSEQREQYQWPTAQTLKQKEKIGPISSKENIFAICQNLDGAEFKSKSTLTIGPKMTTETKSKFAWPDPALVIKRDIIKAPKSQMSIGGPKVDEIIEKTMSSTFSADSIVPVVAPAPAPTTTEVVVPAPSVPIVSRQREVVDDKVTAASDISSVSAPPRKTYSLQLQDSAAAMRIAKTTGLRIDEQKMMNRPRSAPIRRTSSLVADQIIATQTKKGSVDSFNPILMHRRFPSSSDKQIGRWRTETKSSFVWSKKK